CAVHPGTRPHAFCRSHLCAIFPRREDPGSGLWLQHRRFGIGRPGRVIFDAAGVPAFTVISDALLSALSLVAAAAAGKRLIVTSPRSSKDVSLPRIKSSLARGLRPRPLLPRSPFQMWMNRLQLPIHQASPCWVDIE